MKSAVSGMETWNAARLRGVGTNLGTVFEADSANDEQVISIQYARVAKSADAKDLKSFFPQGECGFKSHPGHSVRRDLDSPISTSPQPFHFSARKTGNRRLRRRRSNDSVCSGWLLSKPDSALQHHRRLIELLGKAGLRLEAAPLEIGRIGLQTIWRT